jgi:hypothetical protein
MPEMLELLVIPEMLVLPELLALAALVALVEEAGELS